LSLLILPVSIFDTIRFRDDRLQWPILRPVGIIRKNCESSEAGIQIIKFCPVVMWLFSKSRIKSKRRLPSSVFWLRTELVAQIEFTEWTPDGHLRHSKFVGLREDKDAGEFARE
jgi:hypothetical protein